MRNFKCSIADMRKQVFAEVARLAYEGGDYRRMEKLPYKIVPGEVGNQRESIFLERAIVTLSRSSKKSKSSVRNSASVVRVSAGSLHHALYAVCA